MKADAWSQYTWRCVDCGRKKRISASQMRYKTRRVHCDDCGSTFFEPATALAREAFTINGTFRGRCA
jgi:DNA-directed RNA polymerase subunit RPC12/RpoP